MKMFLWRTAVFSALILMGAALATPAPAQAEGEFMYVDIARVVSTSKVGQELARRVRNLREKASEELTEKGKTLREERQALERRRDVMAQDAYSRAEEELAKKEGEFRAEAYRRQQEVQEEVAQDEREVDRILNEIMTGVLERRKLGGIFDRRGLLVAPPEADLTSEIVAELDRRLPRLNQR